MDFLALVKKAASQKREIEGLWGESNWETVHAGARVGLARTELKTAVA